MLRGNIRLYLRALQNIFQFEYIRSAFSDIFSNSFLLSAQHQLSSGVLPTPPLKVLVKDLNQVDLKFYTYHSARNILKKHKVL